MNQNNNKLKKFLDKLNAPTWTPLGVLAFTLWVTLPSRTDSTTSIIGWVLFFVAFWLRIFYQFSHPEAYRVCATCFVDIKKMQDAINKHKEETAKRQTFECALCHWQCGSDHVKKDKNGDYGGFYMADCQECKVTRRFNSTAPQQ